MALILSLSLGLSNYQAAASSGGGGGSANTDFTQSVNSCTVGAISV